MTRIWQLRLNQLITTGPSTMTPSKVGSGIETASCAFVTIKVLNSIEMATRREKGLSCSDSYSSILVHHLNKFGYFTSLVHPFMAKQVVKQFIQHVTTIHGMLEFIIMDHASIFLSSFWRKFFKLWGMTFKISIEDHQQTKDKRTNLCLETYLRCCATLNGGPFSCLGYNCGIIALFFRLPESFHVKLFLDVPSLSNWTCLRELPRW